MLDFYTFLCNLKQEEIDRDFEKLWEELEDIPVYENENMERTSELQNK